MAGQKLTGAAQRRHAECLQIAGKDHGVLEGVARCLLCRTAARKTYSGSGSGCIPSALAPNCEADTACQTSSGNFLLMQPSSAATSGPAPPWLSSVATATGLPGRQRLQRGSLPAAEHCSQWPEEADSRVHVTSLDHQGTTGEGKRERPRRRTPGDLAWSGCRSH